MKGFRGLNLDGDVPPGAATRYHRGGSFVARSVVKIAEMLTTQRSSTAAQDLD